MDQIRLTGIRAAGKHGVLDFEHERAQTFVVDATLSLDLAPAGRSDALDDTVDYGAIAKGIVAIIEGEHADLIERLAARIADMILQYPAVQRAEVTVHKPNAPIVVPFDDVSVTVERAGPNPPTRIMPSSPWEAIKVMWSPRYAMRCVASTDSTPLRSPAFRRYIAPTHGACQREHPTSAMRSFPSTPS